MSTKVKRFAVLSVMVGLVFLTARSPTEKFHGPIDEGEYDFRSYPLGIDSTSIESTLETTPSHIEDTIDDILIIDADVEIPLVGNRIAGFTAQRIVWDLEQIAPLFFKNSFPDVQIVGYEGHP